MELGESLTILSFFSSIGHEVFLTNTGQVPSVGVSFTSNNDIQTIFDYKNNRNKNIWGPRNFSKRPPKNSVILNFLLFGLKFLFRQSNSNKIKNDLHIVALLLACTFYCLKKILYSLLIANKFK